MCAPVVLTGTGGSQASFDSLPDMFTANIGRGCGTQDSTDVIFPDPGLVVERNNGATTAFATPTGADCKTGSGGARPTGNVGPTISSVPAGGGASSGGTSATTSARAPAVASSAPGFSGSYSITSGGAVTSKAPATPSIALTAVPATVAAPGNSGSSGALTGSCTLEGEFNCIDGTNYQQCGSGHWSIAMPVALGTRCTVGRGGSLNIAAGKLRFLGRRFEA